MTESNDLHQSFQYSDSQQRLNPHLCFHLHSTLRSSSLSPKSLVVGLSCLTSVGLLSTSAAAYEEFSIPMDDSIYESVPAAPYEPSGSTSAYDTWQPEAYDTESYYSQPQTESYSAPTEDYYYAEPQTESYSAPTEDYYYSQPQTESYSAPTEDYYYSDPQPEQYDTPSTLYLPKEREIAPPAPQQFALPAKPQLEKQFNPTTPTVITEAETPSNNYIDPTDYSIGATGGYQSPTSVILTERSSGCQVVLGLGEHPSGQWCGTSPQQPYNPGVNPVVTANTQTPIYQSQTAATASGSYYGATASASSQWYGGSSGYQGLTSVSPVRVGPLYASAMSNSGLTYYNRTKRPPSLPGNGDIALLFPLSIPAPITSLFGWRQHPVYGYNRFHTGMDMGADTGTPVVASYSGQVSIADWLGGYGLTVVLDHQKKSQETLYGHLSELFVKPGEWVKQGEVIGRVGNTGVSTGPHLHFELRKLTNQGWVAIDPQNQIQMALAGILNTLQVAEVPSQDFISTLDEQMKDWETGTPQLPPLPPNFEVTIPNLEPPTLDFGFTETIVQQN